MSLRSRGTRGWFHSSACADTYRQRGRAIDAAIREVAEAYEASETLPAEQRRILRADLGWFLDLRQMDAPLGEGRDPLGAAPIAEPAVRRVLGLKA